MFPHRLTDSRAYVIAQALVDGFNLHYRLFRETSAAAKQRFEQQAWHDQQHAQDQRKGSGGTGSGGAGPRRRGR